MKAKSKEKDSAKKQAQRLAKAKPLLHQFKAWLDRSALQVPPKSAIGKAIAYSLGQWSKLERYVEYGNLQIGTNISGSDQHNPLNNINNRLI